MFDPTFWHVISWIVTKAFSLYQYTVCDRYSSMNTGLWRCKDYLLRGVIATSSFTSERSKLEKMSITSVCIFLLATFSDSRSFS